MFDLTRNQRIPHLQEKDMPVASWTCWAAAKRKFVVVRQGFTGATLTVPRVHQEQQDVEKGA